MYTIIISAICVLLTAIIAIITVINTKNSAAAKLETCQQAAAAKLQTCQLTAAAEKKEALAAAEKEKALLEASVKNLEAAIMQLTQDKEKLEGEKKQLQEDNTQLTADLQSSRTSLREKEAAATKAEEERLKSEKKTLDLLEERMKNMTQTMLEDRSKALTETNTLQMEQICGPLKTKIEEINKLMGENKSTTEATYSKLEGAFQAMVQQTRNLSDDANKLADALKHKGKVHGDWGEQMLEDILAESGLIEGREFFRQDSYKGKSGNELRPDVVVKTASGQSIVIDSKVSLTDYANAVGAETEEERKEYTKKNFESVKKHVKELAAKEYQKYVPGSMNYVLMFIPNEGAYTMAMNHDRSLMQEAFKEGIVIINPTNLMLTLYLVLQTWNGSRQEDNCKAIIKAANGMYEKVIGIVDNMTQLGEQLQRVQSTYVQTAAQISTGTGNLLGRVEVLKQMGITSTKTPKKRKSLEAQTDANQALPQSADEQPAEEAVEAEEGEE